MKIYPDSHRPSMIFHAVMCVIAPLFTLRNFSSIATALVDTRMLYGMRYQWIAQLSIFAGIFLTVIGIVLTLGLIGKGPVGWYAIYIAFSAELFFRLIALAAWRFELNLPLEEMSSSLGAIAIISAFFIPTGIYYWKRQNLFGVDHSSNYMEIVGAETEDWSSDAKSMERLSQEDNE